LEKLEGDAELNTVASAKAGLKDMRLLFEYLEVYGCLDKVRPVKRLINDHRR
jgi:histidyl-tRNA synthetase